MDHARAGLSVTWNRRSWLAVSLGLTACARSGKRTIGVVPQGRTHMFWQTVHAGAVAAARERNVEILWNGPATENDFAAQLQIVNNLINRRVDAIAIAPIDRKALVGVVERAVREKIPVVIFDTGVDSEQIVTQIATDNYGAGVLAGERMGEILGGKGKVVIVAALPGSASSMARERGFEEILSRKFPDLHIVDKRFGMSDYAKSLAITENMLTSHPDLSGVFGSNESSTAGAAQALKSRSSKVKLVGFDSSPALLDHLRSGIIDSLVIQDPFRMGAQSVNSACDHLDGKLVEKKQPLPPRLVRRADMDEPEAKRLLYPELKKYLSD